MSSRSLRPSGRKIGVAALAASLGLAGLGLAASPAQALPGFAFERLAGEDRIETAVEISADTFATSTTALIARADLFPDALAGNYLAGAEGAPILLSHTDEVPQETLDELARLGVTDVTLLGGTAALDDSVQAALEAEGYTVSREAGTDRYETAADIATSQDAATIGTTADGRTALLATGEKFADALTGGPLAYANSHPLLLTPSAALGDDASGALEALGIEHVVILGGSSAVSDTVEAELTAMGMTSERLAGDTRYETATDIAEYALTQGFTDAHINAATGLKFPDALTGGPHAGEEVTPIILANDGNTAEAVAYLEAHADTLVDGHIFGGTAAVSQAVEDTLTAAAQGDVQTNQSFAVTPAGNQTVEQGTVSQFTVSGITSSVVDIALVGCENITTDENGVSTFPNSSNPGGSGNVANLAGAEITSDITVINGTAVTEEQSADNVAVNNGSVSFTVSNGAPDCYVAVVFSDADNDNNLDLGTNNQPTEAFANSGDITIVPPEAADSAGVGGPVAQVDKANDLFTNGTNTFYYDSNDEFLLEAGAVDTVLTMAQFEERISAGDGITGTYRNNPANQSSFTLTDSAPVAPTNVVAKTPDGTNAGKAGVEVEFTDSTTATVAKYDIFRATATQPTITGQPVTCPTVASGAYSDIGDVANVVGTTTYQFLDSTATVPPAATPTNPSYCYYVVSVDATGDVGPASTIAGPQAATAGDTTGAPEFASATAETGSTVVVVNYDEDIKPTSNDANASNYAVTVTRGGVTTALTEVSTTNDDANTVSITVSGIPGGAFQSGDEVVATAQNGDDGNTVLDLTDVAQPVGDAVLAVAGDTVAPMIQSATFTNAGGIALDFDTAGDEIALDYDEVMGATATTDDVVIAGTIYNCGTEVLCALDGADGSIVNVTYNGTPIAAAAGKNVETGTTFDDTSGNVATGYPEAIV